MIQIDNYPVTVTKMFSELALNDFFEANGALHQKISINPNASLNSLKYANEAAFPEAAYFISTQLVVAKNPNSYNISIVF